jgi:malate dehydrogenase (oxaloacetate-decarboxylating)
VLRPTTVAYSISLKVRLQNLPGALGRLTTAVGEAGGNITAIEAGVVRLHRAV